MDDPPVAADDSYSVDEDATLTVVDTVGVLANDSDVDSTILTASIQSNPTNGTVTLQDDGAFTYVPNANFFGTDSFTYVASDGVNDSAVATVSISVVAQPDPPTASDDTANALNDGTVTTIDVLSNDTSDPDATQSLAVVTVTQGSSGGVVSFNSSAVSYTVPIGFTGTDTFTYVVEDADGLTDTATVVVTVVESADNSLSGHVYIDADGDGLFDAGELGVPGAQITLTGTDLLGGPVNRVLLTDDTGLYRFDELPAGTYQVQERQPTALLDGLDSTAVAGAVVSNDLVTNIELSGGQSAGGNDFGELGLRAQYISIIWFFASSHASTRMLTNAIADAEALAGHLELAAAIREGNVNYGNDDNTSPVAVDDAFDVDEDAVLSVSAASGVLANDSDADGDSLAAQLVAIASHGTVSLSADGSFSYTPDADFFGSDSFSYRVTDGNATSGVATVTLVVDPVDDTPVANDDAYQTNQDTALERTGTTGVLANDVDADGDTLTVQIVSTSANGTLAMEADGGFVYTPAAGFAGTDSFVYQVSDGTTLPVNATVVITVLDVNDPPVAADDAYSVDEDTVLTVNDTIGLLVNDSDVDGDTLTASLVSDVAHGTLNLSSDGSFTYTPDADFHGTDTFTYLANDGSEDSQTATVTLTVTPVNDAPTAVDDLYSVAVDGTLTVNVAVGLLVNDADVDGDALTAVLVDDVTDGTLSLAADGSFTYSPTSGFHGVDSFTYRSSDGTLESSVTTVTIQVNSVPQVTEDAYAVDEDQSLVVDASLGVLANDVDVDGDTLTVTVIDQPDHGALTLETDGAFEYTPAANYHGTDTFTYVAHDGFAASAEVTVTITVNSVNDAPVAADDAYSVNEDAVLNVAAVDGVQANDVDVDGDTLTATLVSLPSNGSVTLNGDGSFDYTPNADFFGADSFTYTVSDGSDASSETTVVITVEPIADPPVAADDAYSVDEDTVLTVTDTTGVLVNDSDADGDTLTASLVSDVAHGTLNLSSDGSFTYTPDADFHGTDTFTYLANDGSEDSQTATVTLTVTPVNDAPTAVDDLYSVAVDGTLTVNVAVGLLVNDADVDGDVLSVVLVDDVTNGTLLLGTHGSFTYTPTSGFHGVDSFTYRSSDGTLESSVTTVTIQVNSVPQVTEDAYAVDEDQSLVVDASLGVLANDVDADGDTLTVTVVDQPDHGALTLETDGAFDVHAGCQLSRYRYVYLCCARRLCGVRRGDGDHYGQFGQRRSGRGGRCVFGQRGCGAQRSGRGRRAGERCGCGRRYADRDAGQFAE